MITWKSKIKGYSQDIEMKNTTGSRNFHFYVII